MHVKIAKGDFVKGKDKKPIAHACSACTSLVCMAQMGAMVATGGAAMGAMSAATTVPFITFVFQAIGLGFLLVLPPIFYQILLIIVLGFTVVTSYFSYHFHKNISPFILTMMSSLLLYSSIYLFISETLYWVAFLLMVISAAWSYRIGKSIKLKSEVYASP